MRWSRRVWRRVGVVAGVIVVLLVGLFGVAWGVNVFVVDRLAVMESDREQERKEQEAMPKLGYNEAEYDRMSEGFFFFADEDFPCVRRLDGVEWVYKNTPGRNIGATVMFEFFKDGFTYNFFYVEKPQGAFRYHLTVRVHNTKLGEPQSSDTYVYSASLRDNKFVAGIGNSYDYMDTSQPTVDQEYWNRRVLEEYSAILRCYYDESEETSAP